MTNEIKVDSKGRILVPKELREEFDIKPGQTVRYTIQDGNLVILKPISNEEFKESVKTFHTKLKEMTDEPLKFEKLSSKFKCCSKSISSRSRFW